jgi:hypothetical protein
MTLKEALKNNLYKAKEAIYKAVERDTVTGWHSHDQKPVRSGYYAVDDPYHPFRYFDVQKGYWSLYKGGWYSADFAKSWKGITVKGRILSVIGVL